MSNLYIYNPNFSYINNQPSLFFNLLSNNYGGKKSINNNIYGNILSLYDENINIDVNFNNQDFERNLTKYLYYTINNNINSYINILIDNNDFLNELFSHPDFKYYTNHNNEVLKLLSDNTESDDTFNISKNYKIFKTKYLNNKKHEKYDKIKTKTIQSLKHKVYEIFIVIDGLEKIMYNKLNNLLEYDKNSFEQIKNIIHNMFGSKHTNNNHIDYIFWKYTNKTIDYYDIYKEVLTYPDLKNKIVQMFIQLNYIKFNNKISKLLRFKQFKTLLSKIYHQFISDKEQDEDDEIINLTKDQRSIVLNEGVKKLYEKYKEHIKENFSDKYVEDYNYSYTNIYNDVINTNIKQIPINYINNLNFNDYKQNTDQDSKSMISNDDIIKEILPTIKPKIDNVPDQTQINNNIYNEAKHRIETIEENRENVDHINYTLSFLKDNFDETEELEKLVDAISYLNFNFINDFDIHKLQILKKIEDNDESKLLSNIINDIDIEDQQQVTNTNKFIIDDYNILSPVHESNFIFKINKQSYKFKTLLHFIYFNIYLSLYNVYVKFSKHKELEIITPQTLSYNLLFKNSSLNIFDESKVILSNKIFKSVNELQSSYYNLINNIKYFLFKLEINKKINSIEIPYLNYILSYTDNMDIIYADKFDNYLGIGKYGNGTNKVGEFFNKYKSYVIKEMSFDYNYTDIFFIMCNFNKNIYKWFEYKLNNLLHIIINVCIVSNTFTLDVIMIDKIINNFFDKLKLKNIFILPIHNSFITFIKNKLNEVSNMYTSDSISISHNSIYELWKLCFVMIHSIFDFQQKIIDNSDNFQTFINKYDKHNIEHILYYILNSHTNNDLEEAINNFKYTQTTKLKLFNSDIILDKYAINILFSSNNANNDYKNIIDNTDLLEFNVNDEVKKINIIKTKLHLFQ